MALTLRLPEGTLESVPRFGTRVLLPEDGADAASVETGRLILRPFSEEDAQPVQSLLNDLEVTSSVAEIPHPYSIEDAVGWISCCGECDRRHSPMSIHRAMVLKADARLIGAVSLMNIDRVAGTSEIGYWVGRQYWSNRFASEAAEAMIEFAFRRIGVRSISLNAFEFNLASRRIAEKLGFRFLGRSERARRCRATQYEHYETRYCLDETAWSAAASRRP